MSRVGPTKMASTGHSGMHASQSLHTARLAAP